MPSFTKDSAGELKLRAKTETPNQADAQAANRTAAAVTVKATPKKETK
jgi:hypothetical protein